MNMTNYPKLHLDINKSKGTELLLLFYISVTVGSSTMRITHILK
jgi:hypothetical protein